MFFSSWLQHLAQRWSPCGGYHRRRAGRAPDCTRRRVRPRLEVLEDRCLLAVTMYDLGTYNLPYSAPQVPTPTSINNQGTVAGLVEAYPGYTGFTWNPQAGITPLVVLPGWQNSLFTNVARSINDGGQIVGYYSEGLRIPLIWSSPTDSYPKPLLTGLSYGEDSEAADINTQGDAVGWVDGWHVDSTGKMIGSEITAATLWKAGSQNPTDLGLGTISEALAINDKDQIVGWRLLPHEGTEAFLANGPGNYIILPTLPGDTEAQAVDINNDGTIIGTSIGISNGVSTTHGVVWQLDPTTNSYTPTELSFIPSAINNNGVVVGQTDAWTAETGTENLNSILPSGSGWYVVATDINDNNQITGLGSLNGSPAAFRMDGFKPGGPIVTPTSLTWNKKQGGVDLSYQVSKDNLLQDMPIAFYWAKGPKKTDIIGPVGSDSTYTVDKGTLAQDQPYGPFHIDGADLTGAPANATYLLAVAEPGGTLASADPTLNVTSIQLVLPVQPVYQNQGGPWANTPVYLGHSIDDTISSSGCALVSLDMALNYEGVNIDPIELNVRLTSNPNFGPQSGYVGVDSLNWGPATGIAAGAMGNLNIHFNLEDNGSSNPQDLRNLLVSNAAPVIVSVNNPDTGHKHFILVTGIYDNTTGGILGSSFTINDPAYPSRETLNAYGNNFTIVGSVTDPPNDISAMYFATSASGTGANLAVVNPQGNMTGLSPLSAQPVNHIPNAVYFTEGPLENLTGPSTDNTTTQFVYISQPSNGDYNILASGATGPTQLELSYASPDGTLQTQQLVTAQLSNGSPLQYQANLDSTHALHPLIEFSNNPTNVAGQLPSGTLGTAYAQTIIASDGSDNLSVTYQVTSGAIPNGLIFALNNNQLTITGTPTASGTVGFFVTATAPKGVSTMYGHTLDPEGVSVMQGYMLMVNQGQSPAITSGSSATFAVGQSGSFTVIATGSPKPNLTESGTLPSGVTFTDNGNGTATLGGAPSAGTNGTYIFSIAANNGVGSVFTQSFTLTVNLSPPPPPPPPYPPIVPPLLALFNQFLGGLETVNANGSTITDNLFGFPLVETFDYSGNLVSVTLLGFNITFLFE